MHSDGKEEELHSEEKEYSHSEEERLHAEEEEQLCWEGEQQLHSEEDKSYLVLDNVSIRRIGLGVDLFVKALERHPFVAEGKEW